MCDCHFPTLSLSVTDPNVKAHTNTNVLLTRYCYYYVGSTGQGNANADPNDPGAARSNSRRRPATVDHGSRPSSSTVRDSHNGSESQSPPWMDRQNSNSNSNSGGGNGYGDYPAPHVRSDPDAPTPRRPTEGGCACMYGICCINGEWAVHQWWNQDADAQMLK